MTKSLFNVSKADLKKETQPGVERSSREVAVIGMAVNLPQAGNLEEFWAMISEARDYVGNIPDYRKNQMDLLRSQYGNKHLQGYDYDQAAYLSDIDGFDHQFFNIPFEDAVVINPMHRKLLQTSFHCLENAGYTRQRITGTRTGVYLGYSWNLNSYFSLIKEHSPELYQYAITQNIASTLAGRLSYYYDLQGPSLVIDTACSSSLVAMHQACESINSGKTDMAMVCGANLTFGLNNSGKSLGIESSSNRSLSFDDDADGIGKGEGIVAVLLKSLPQAIRDKDPIQAVIKGSAINNDGGRSVGAAAPSVKAQRDVLVSAWTEAGINPENIGYIEAHGTGTKLGDPIEVQALTDAFENFTKKKQFCALGSVKANIGHLDTAAGISGFVKSVLCLQKQQFPPQANFQRPNRKISFLESAMFVNTHLRKWQSSPDHERLAGVSAFGFSGTNCHVLLAEHQAQTRINKPYEEGYHLFTLSAKSKRSLDNLVAAHALNLENGWPGSIQELCTSLALYREHFEHRMVIITTGLGDLLVKLKQVLEKSVGSFQAEWSFNSPEKPSSSQKSKTVLSITHSEMSSAALACQEYLKTELPGFNPKTNIPFRFPLPNYPFDEQSCWIMPAKDAQVTEEASRPIKQSYTTQPSKMLQQMPDITQLKNRLKEIVAESLNTDVASIQTDKTFFELGFDSINLIHIKRKLQKEFNVDLALEDLFSDLNTLDKLADLPELQTSATPVSSTTTNGESLTKTVPTISANGSLGEMSALFARQMSLMEEQIKLLQATQGQASEMPGRPVTSPVSQIRPANGAQQTRPTSHAYSDSGKTYTPGQRAFLKDLISRLSKRTQKSKALTQEHRKPFASYRKAMYYDHYFKELVYPIFAAKASGCRFTDLDGNEYLDFAMGYGVHLLGYNPPEVVEAVNRQVQEGIFIGPMSPLAGELTKMLHDVTGLERFAYANSGTEAVMHAIRVARGKTGKNLVIKFNNAYHGFYDVIQAVPDPTDELHSIAGSRGVPQGMVDDVLVLEYGTKESLEIIRQKMAEAACVLVEPVQSRRPEFQPVEFLKALREITAEANVPLIFDEIITGFRLHQKGAMGYYGIEPDIVTYGKVIGGTMPLGIVGGKASYLDYMDGGFWQYGDDSRPSDLRVGTGGTFCHHPVALAAAKATLEVIQREGDELYSELNRKTERLRDQLNQYFELHEIPVKIVNCGSLFSFKPQRDVRVMQVLYYLLQERGIYLWQGATSFVSRAHTDEDIETLIKTVDECCQVLIEQGFVKPKEAVRIVLVPEADHYAVSPSQRRLWFMHQLYPELNAYNQTAAYKTRFLELDPLTKTVSQVVKRHESLRTRFITVKDQPRQVIDAFNLEKHGMQLRNGEALTEEDIIAELKREMEVVFDLKNGPLFKIMAYKRQEENYLFINLHHLVADGLSIEIVLQEIMLTYQALLTGIKPNLRALTFQYKDYSAWINAKLNGVGAKVHRDYWANKLRNSQKRVVIQPDLNPEHAGFEGDMELIRLSETETTQLRALAQKEDCTLFVLIMTIIKVLINKQAGNGPVSVGCPYSGRFSEDFYHQVGFYVNTLVLSDDINSQDSFKAALQKVKQTVAEASKHQIYPYDQLVQDLSEDRGLSKNQLFDIDVNMNEQDLGNYKKPQAEGAALEAIDLKPATTKFDITFSICQGRELAIALEYKTALFEKATIMQMRHRLLNIVATTLENPLSIQLSQIDYDRGMTEEQDSLFEKKELF